MRGLQLVLPLLAGCYLWPCSPTSAPPASPCHLAATCFHWQVERNPLTHPRHAFYPALAGQQHLDCLASQGVTLWELLGLLGPQQLKALSTSPAFYHMPAGEPPKEPLGALLEVRRAQHGRGMPAVVAIAHMRA